MPLLLTMLFLGLQSPTVLSVPTYDTKSVWIEALHQCENPHDIPKIVDSNGYYSYGKYMWQMRSWLNYKKQGATKENISDPNTQDKITRYALDNGGWKNWYNCGKKLNASIGAYE